MQKQNMESFLKLFFFFGWLVQFRKNKSKFSWFALLFKQFFIKIQSSMSEQEKKRQRLYDLLNAKTEPKKFPKWNSMSEEFILKVCKSFWRRVDTMIEKKIVVNKFTVLCLFLILLFIS